MLRDASFATVMLALATAVSAQAQRPSPAFHNPPPPPVFLNHATMVLDSATYHDIVKSAFLTGEFASVKIGSEERAPGTAEAGVSIYGTQTYVQILSAGSGAVRNVEGMSGIGLGVDESDGILRVYARLYDTVGGDSTRTGLRLAGRRRGAQEVPWYYVTAIAPAGERPDQRWFDSWVMQYHPQYLQQWYPDLKPAGQGTGRAQVLAPLRNPRGYLKDIVGITLALTDADAQTFLLTLRALGYQISRSPDAVEARGPDIDFRVVPAAAERHGVVEMRLSLLRPKEGQKVYRFGPRSELRFVDGTSAVWTF